jgi:conjugal transfer pilus assembly protein TraL
MSNQDFKIPRYIDDPGQFFFWDMDEAAIAIVILMMGMIFHFFFTGLILAIAAGTSYAKLKHGKPRGFFLHFLYYHNVLDLKGLPPAYIKEFME